MAMAMRLRDYLKSSGIDYEEVHHPREVSSTRIAQRTHVTGDRLAKGVLVNADEGFILAVVPSTHRLDLHQLSTLLHERLGLATEDDIEARFADCDAGAVPAIGEPYGLKVCVDEALCDQPDVFFEAGDHETLIHMSGDDFTRLMKDAEIGKFSRHA